jgi:hypothetical protein
MTERGRQLDESVVDAKGNIEQKLGCCLLLLQSYERLLKKLGIQHKVSGSAESLVKAQEERANFFSNKTLGQVVGELTGTFLTQSSPDAPENKAESDSPPESEYGVWLSYEHTIQMSPENFAQAKRDWAELVALRNELVHHFIERFDLETESGCHAAVGYLNECYVSIDGHYQKLLQWSASMEKSRSLSASILQTPQFQDLLLHGISPNGEVLWAMSTIVELLHDAEKACGSQAGWTSLDDAKQWILTRHPDQTPEKYHCHSWQQVLQDSGLFQIERRKDAEGPARRRWYRSKPPESTL